MVETLTEADENLTRRLFGWIVHAEPELAHAVNHPEIEALIAEDRQLLAGKIDDDMIASAKHAAGLLVAAIRKQFAEHLATDPGDGLSDPRIDELIDILGEAKRGYSHHLSGLAVITASYVFYEDFHYPQPETGIYDIAHSTADKLKWVYRYWFNQLEVAQRGSGLEEFFRGQVLQNHVAMDTSPVESVSRVSLSCAGDLLAVDVLTPENTGRLFEDIADFYSSADIVSANLESTVYSARAQWRRGGPAVQDEHLS